MVRVIITIIPQNGGSPEWQTPGMAGPNRSYSQHSQYTAEHITDMLKTV